MPTYVYKILKTGKKFEVEQRITEAAWTKHPETGEAVERVIQAAGIVFKGSGFYKTDSRPSEKLSGKKDKKADSDSGSSTSSSADSTSSGSSSSGSNSADSGKTDSSTKTAKSESTAAKSAASDSSKPSKTAND